MANPNYIWQTWRDINWREAVPGSPLESFAIDAAKAEMKFYIPWEERHLAVPAFCGYTAQASTLTGQAYLVRYTPFPHARYPGYLYCDSIRFDQGDVPTGQDALGQAEWEDANAHLGFSAPYYRILTDQELVAKLAEIGHSSTWPDESALLRYVTIRNQPRGKYQELPPLAALKWNSDSTAMSASQVVLLAESDLTIIWHQVPLSAIPWKALIDKTVYPPGHELAGITKGCVGKTNRYSLGAPGSVIGGPDGIIGPGQLVCLFPEIKFLRMANGEYAADIHYKFTMHPWGANNFYRWNPPGNTDPDFFAASRGGGASIDLATGALTGTAKKMLFPPADFRALFRPGEAF